MRKLFLFLLLFFISVGRVEATRTTGETIIVRKDGTYELIEGKYVGALNLEEGEYTQPNFIYDLHDEPYQNKQWHLDNLGADEEADIDYKAAMKELEGTKLSEIIVAVLDTGVDYLHEDLKDVMWDGTDCVSETGGKLGGCKYGYSFAYGGSSNDPHPTKGSYGGGYYHGTHVAGIVAAAINGKGVASVAKNAKIMAIRADSGEGLETIDLIRGIAFARQNGAKIINASWGSGCGKPEDSEDKALKNEIAKFPGLFVASAGNATCNHDRSFTVPSSYRSVLDNMVVVAASDPYDGLTSFSDYGGSTVDVAAPGENILSTVPKSYRSLDGTSMASPVVAGILAVVWGFDPTADRDMISKILRETVDEKKSLTGYVMTDGRVDLLNAVKEAKSVLKTPTITNTPTPTLTLTPTPPSCPSCKANGDYNCDGTVNGLDYSWWKQEFVDKIQHGGKWTASRTCSGTVTTEDFSAWRDGYLK